MKKFNPCGIVFGRHRSSHRRDVHFSRIKFLTPNFHSLPRDEGKRSKRNFFPRDIATYSRVTILTRRYRSQRNNYHSPLVFSFHVQIRVPRRSFRVPTGREFVEKSSSAISPRNTSVEISQPAAELGPREINLEIPSPCSCFASPLRSAGFEGRLAPKETVFPQISRIIPTR